MSRPVLVTGSHRSGTTWTGRMLALDHSVGYIHEPFNPDSWPGWFRKRPPFWFQYVCAENEAEFTPLMEDVLAFRYPIANIGAATDRRQVRRMATEFIRSLGYRSRRARPLLKAPIAVMSAEWLAQRFDCEVVVMIRHPAAFASSLKQLQWRFGFEQWADQPLLMRNLIGPFAAQVASAGHDGDIIDQAILMWNVIHHVILGYRDRHPDWVFVRHEDLCEEPLQGFRELFERLDLRWSHRVGDKVARSSTGVTGMEIPVHMFSTVQRDSRAARWTWLKRLTEEERVRIREGTSGVAGNFYGAEDWERGAAAP